ncbi:MAG: hypothetical protein GY953_33935, partial [bacterium]|nr:hypothetical protein [bacterium]
MVSLIHDGPGGERCSAGRPAGPLSLVSAPEGDQACRPLTPRLTRGLAERLLRRVLELAHSYGPAEVTGSDFDGLLALAEAVLVSTSILHWHDWGSYSNRQQTKM